MGLVTKIVSAVAPKAADVVAKYTGKALSVTRNVGGIPVKTYLKTGTQVAKNIDGQGTKSIALGIGNRLRTQTGITNITAYPKGSFFGGKDGLILCSGSPKNMGLPFTFKEFGEFTQMLKDVAKANKAFKI